MAGSYPDVPSRRMAYDEDGTLVFVQNQVSLGALVELGANKTTINKEDNSTYTDAVGGNGQTRLLWWIFPELREFDGIFTASGQTFPSTFGAVHTSGNTTNGIDGTFAQQVADLPDYTTVYPTNYRNNITSTAVSNVRSVRFYCTAAGNVSTITLTGVHVYGEITPGQTPDRLLFIDTGTNLEFSLPIDYGDIPRGSAADRTFKLKNNSSSLTASTVQLTAEALYLTSGSWYTFSSGGAFQSTLALGSSIGNGASSATITLRRDIPDSETTGLHAGRVQVSVGTWA